MNLSFDGVVSNTFNTLPVPFTDNNSSASNNNNNPNQNKRPFGETTSSGNRNKRPRSASENNNSQYQSSSQDGATQSNDNDNQPMSDDSLTSVGSLDEFAETLRECTQNLDSYLDSSSSRLLSGYQGRRAGGSTPSMPLGGGRRIRRDGPDRL